MQIDFSPKVMNPENPFQDDLLQREHIANQLTAYIDRLNNGAVIAIDADWGEGKTWFGTRWAAKLDAEKDRKVAYIDAFADDYVDDPFTLIASELSTLFESESSHSVALKRTAGTVAKALAPLATKAFISAAGRVVVAATGIDTEAIVDAIKDSTGATASAAEKWMEKRIDAVALERKSIRGFQDSLKAAAEGETKPVVIFVDELDRCRPSFAVTLIERVKHLFNVPKLVFVLLLNRSQLEKAIQGVYGHDVDGHAYLGKFVSLWFELPSIKLRNQGHDGAWKPFINDVLQRYHGASHNSFARDLDFWADKMGMSLRDIERACALFVLANSRSNPGTSYLIATKIKYANRFRGLRANDPVVAEETAKWLEGFMRGLTPEELRLYPTLLLPFFAQLHRVQAGTVPIDKADIVAEKSVDVLEARDAVRGFARLADIVDLPIGR